MIEKIQKYRKPLLIGLIIFCMGIMALGAVVYLERINDRLQSGAIQDVMDVTIQQRQAFESFVSGDRERLHNYAERFAEGESVTEESAQEQLKMVGDMEAVYSVLCLEEGWACSNAYQDIVQLNEEQLDFFRGLSGIGLWDNYTGIFTGVPMFGYYTTHRKHLQ